MKEAIRLPKEIRKLIDYELAKETRIHKVVTSDSEFWIKREDELSSGISGSKLRKYASLLPYLKSNSFDLVGIVGGPNSNNLVGLTQVLIENGLRPIVFARKPSDERLQGNSLLLSLLLDHDAIHHIDHQNWPDVETIASKTLKELYPNNNTVALNEGCLMPEALLGSLTLAEDIIRNELLSGQRFSHIYIDSGTGLTAIGLILGFELLSPQTENGRQIVVTHIAGESKTFEMNLIRFRKGLQDRFGFTTVSTTTVIHNIPPTARKYGHVNSTVLAECGYIAKNLGILMDPVYSVKHYMSFRHHQSTLPPHANPLFVFNGSALGLMGFQNALSPH